MGGFPAKIDQSLVFPLCYWMYVFQLSNGVQYIGDVQYIRGVQYIGDVQYIGGHHDECGGYHEYIGGCSVHWRVP